MNQTVFRSDLFSDKVALVTGGGTGIGLRIARDLASLGAIVVLASRKTENLDAGVRLIAGEGGKAYGIGCNIRDESSVKDCIESTLRLAGRLDFLVNNAGGQFPQLAEKITLKGWNAVIETNLTGPFLMSKEAFNQVFAASGGVIVNILADIWNGFPRMSHGAAARAGVDNLTKTLATEWGRFGVRMNSVAPGIIRSNGLGTYSEEYRRFMHECGKNNLAYRLGTEQEVSSAVLFLLSPGAQFINGQTLRVDGGESIYSPLMPPEANDRIPPFEGFQSEESR